MPIRIHEIVSFMNGVDFIERSLDCSSARLLNEGYQKLDRAAQDELARSLRAVLIFGAAVRAEGLEFKSVKAGKGKSV